MAKSKQEKAQILLRAGVTLTGKEKVEELDELIETNLNVKAEATPIIPEAPKPKVEAKKAVHFVMYDGSRRSFSEEIHGETFNEIADEFHTTNSDRIKDRKHE